jgi:hypothetical protein
MRFLSLRTMRRSTTEPFILGNDLSLIEPGADQSNASYIQKQKICTAEWSRKFNGTLSATTIKKRKPTQAGRFHSPVEQMPAKCYVACLHGFRVLFACFRNRFHFHGQLEKRSARPSLAAYYRLRGHWIFLIERVKPRVYGRRSDEELRPPNNCNCAVLDFLRTKTMHPDLTNRLICQLHHDVLFHAD